MAKIIVDNLAYAKVVRKMGTYYPWSGPRISNQVRIQASAQIVQILTLLQFYPKISKQS
jgi:hypothetical protein